MDIYSGCLAMDKRRLDEFFCCYLYLEGKKDRSYSETYKMKCIERFFRERNDGPYRDEYIRRLDGDTKYRKRVL